MRWIFLVLFLPLFALPFRSNAGDKMAEQTKAKTIKNIEKFLKQRYIPTVEPIKPLDHEPESEPTDTDQSKSNPPDSVTYWYGASYVVRFIFATDGTLSSVSLFPEALLHSNSWSTVPDGAELSPNQMESLVAIADQLQPMGKVQMKYVPPNFCFQSGANLYCGDGYEHASVSHYWREEFDGQLERRALKDVTIAYHKIVSGTVIEVRAVEDDEDKKDLKIGSSWYRINRIANAPFFEKTTKGSTVHLTSAGCVGNEKVCDAYGPAAPMPKE
jgi:hypothetical protein